MKKSPLLAPHIPEPFMSGGILFTSTMLNVKVGSRRRGIVMPATVQPEIAIQHSVNAHTREALLSIGWATRHGGRCSDWNPIQPSASWLSSYIDNALRSVCEDEDLRLEVITRNRAHIWGDAQPRLRPREGKTVKKSPIVRKLRRLDASKIVAGSIASGSITIDASTITTPTAILSTPPGIHYLPPTFPARAPELVEADDE